MSECKHGETVPPCPLCDSEIIREAERQRCDEISAENRRLREALKSVLSKAIDDYYKEHDCDGVLKEAWDTLNATGGRDE